MIEVNIKKTYQDFALEAAFKIDREMLALFGPSGSGKTTTFQCISGLLNPDEGHIKLNGRVLFDSCKGINIMPRDRKIGYIFQDYALFPHLTVRKNISFGMRGSDKQQINDKVDVLLKTMRLTGLGERLPRQLSGGQQQRVALARALAMEPELLLMDEPFSALDSKVKEELEEEILELQQFYQGDIILITHNLTEAYRLSDKIAIYRSGRIRQIGAKEEIIVHPADKKIAALTGMRNLIPGRIDRIMEQKLIVSTFMGDLTVKYKNTTGLQTGEEICLGIRPELISIKNIPGENVVSCSLVRMIEGISSFECILRPELDLPQQVHLYGEISKTESPGLHPGSCHYIYLPPENLSVIRA